MKLFCRNGSTIEIYQLIPNSKNMKHYKLQELSEIPEKERILKARTNSGAYLNREDAYWQDLQFEYMVMGYQTKTHQMLSYEWSEEEQNREKMILANYIAGKYDNWRLSEVHCYQSDPYLTAQYPELHNKWKTLKYLLHSSYQPEYGGEFYTLDNIISLPDSLAHLYFLQNASYHRLRNIVLKKELINLFDKELIATTKVYHETLDDTIMRYTEPEIVEDELSKERYAIFNSMIRTEKEVAKLIKKG